jgi:hypothetical protein
MILSMRKILIFILSLNFFGFNQIDCDNFNWKEYSKSNIWNHKSAFALRFDSNKVSLETNNYRLLYLDNQTSPSEQYIVSLEFVKLFDDSKLYGTLNIVAPGIEQTQGVSATKKWYEYVDSSIKVGIVKDINQIDKDLIKEFNFLRNKELGIMHDFRTESMEEFSKALIEYADEPNSAIMILSKIDGRELLLVLPLCFDFETFRSFKDRK